MAKISLNTTVKKCAGVISLKDFDHERAQTVIKDLTAYFNIIGLMDNWACIVHDRDTDLDGKLKTCHVHFVFTAKKKKMKSTWLNALSRATGIPALAITLESYSSFEAVIQYLIHKNNAEKFQYCQSEIVSSFPADELDEYIQADYFSSDYDSIMTIVIRSNTLLDVMRELGLGVYQHYRKAILDIWYMVKEHGYMPKNYGND